MLRIVITMHGVMTFRKKETWQDDVSKEPMLSHLKFLSFKYGFVGPILSWLMTWGRKFDDIIDVPTPIRDYYVGKFCRYLIKTRKENPTAQISIAAHSFGGWIAEKALERITRQKKTTFSLHSLVYLHCPISSFIKFSNYRFWFDHKMIKKVYSWSSENDEVIKYLAIYPFGNNGAHGFLREDDRAKYYQPYPKLPIYCERTQEEHEVYILNKSEYLKKFKEQFD